MWRWASRAPRVGDQCGGTGVGNALSWRLELHNRSTQVLARILVIIVPLNFIVYRFREMGSSTPQMDLGQGGKFESRKVGRFTSINPKPQGLEGEIGPEITARMISLPEIKAVYSV